MQGGFVTKASVAKLGPNLIMLRFKVRTNGVLCLLDLGTMHLFVSVSVVKRLEWVATNMAKPIKVHLAQKVLTLADDVVLGAILECDKVKFVENFTIYTLDSIEAILGNTFLDIYHADVLRGGFKFKIITRLVDESISLEAKYQANLAKVGIHFVSL